jgi:phage terminase large subunit-like protein
VELSPALRKRLTTWQTSIVHEASHSSFRPLSSDVKSKHGLNIHGAVVDELHAHPTREMHDVLTTGRGSRRQPLIFEITTAGYDRESICWHQREYGVQILEGVIADDSFFAFIATLDDDDDWRDERVWAKANPNLGVSAKLDSLRDEAVKAGNDPTALNAFLRLRLNVWTTSEIRWMQPDKWAACGRRFVEEDLRGQPCVAAVDLSSQHDLTAAAFLFPPYGERKTYRALVKFWLPEVGFEKRLKKPNAPPFDVWRNAGWIALTPGDLIDYEFVRRALAEMAGLFEIRLVAFDPFNATHLGTLLEGDGFTVLKFPQGFPQMSEPTRVLMELVTSGQFEHDGNPVLAWNIDNVTVKANSEGAIRPAKKLSREKIDGATALITALGAALRTPAAGEPPILEVLAF